MALVFLGALLDAPGRDRASRAPPRRGRARRMRGWSARAASAAAIQQSSHPRRSADRRRARRRVRRDERAVARTRRASSSRRRSSGSSCRGRRTHGETEERGPFFAELAEGHAVHLEPARSCAHSSLMVLVSNLIEAPFPVVMAVFAEEEYGSADRPRAHVRRLRRRRRWSARSSTARSGTGCRDGGRSSCCFTASRSSTW